MYIPRALSTPIVQVQHLFLMDCAKDVLSYSSWDLPMWTEWVDNTQTKTFSFSSLAQSVTRRIGGSISWYLVDLRSDFLDRAGKTMEWCLGIDRSGMRDRIKQ
jgi:hypothetical protein